MQLVITKKNLHLAQSFRSLNLSTEAALEVFSFGGSFMLTIVLLNKLKWHIHLCFPANRDQILDF